MSIFFNLRKSTWSLWSESDKRWNCSGRCEIITVFEKPIEVEKEIEKLTKKYGNPPKDLKFSVMKD